MNFSGFVTGGSLFLFLLCTSSQLVSNPDNVFSSQDLVGMGIQLLQNNRFAFAPINNNGYIRIFRVQPVGKDSFKLEFSHEILQIHGRKIDLYSRK